MPVLNLVDFSDRGIAGEWSPREALAELIDSIDSGAIDPFQIVVVYRARNSRPGYIAAGPGSPYDKTGMVQAWLHRYLHEVEGSTFDG